MRKYSIWYLKGFILLVCLILAVLSGMFLYSLFEDPVNPKYAGSIYPILVAMYLSLLPVFYTLFSTFKLVSGLEKKENQESRQHILQKISKASLIFGGIYVIALPFMYKLADLDDAPGLILFGTLPILLAAAVYAALQLILENGERYHS